MPAIAPAVETGKERVKEPSGCVSAHVGVSQWLESALLALCAPCSQNVQACPCKHELLCAWIPPPPRITVAFGTVGPSWTAASSDSGHTTQARSDRSFRLVLRIQCGGHSLGTDSFHLPLSSQKPSSFAPFPTQGSQQWFAITSWVCFGSTCSTSSAGRGRGIAPAQRVAAVMQLVIGPKCRTGNLRRGLASGGLPVNRRPPRLWNGLRNGLGI